MANDPMQLRSTMQPHMSHQAPAVAPGASQQEDAAGLAAAVMVLEHVLMVRTKLILQIALYYRVSTYVLHTVLEPVLLVCNAPTCQIAI